MTSAYRRLRILAGGSLDVDNFGDLLFFLITEQYLGGAEVIPVGPFGWDMETILGRKVFAYSPVLESELVDVVWVLGGEMGPSTLDGAFRISAPRSLYRAYLNATSDERERILARAMGVSSTPPIVHAYMPPHFAFPLNAGAVSVLNSVGISHILDQHPQPDTCKRYLRNLTFASVRDRESSELLASLGVEHVLVPDAVHALGVLRPATYNNRLPVAIFQISKPVIERYGVGNVADVLAGSQSLRGLRLRILMTGTWRHGADSLRRSRELATRLKHLVPDIDIDILPDRHPFEIVDHIKAARVVIGTSLHLRVTACAYNVPRVTLSIFLSNKPTRYASLWDPEMPYDVSLKDLDAAVGRAMARADDRHIISRSAQLAKLAHENLASIADRVLDLAPRAHRPRGTWAGSRGHIS